MQDLPTTGPASLRVIHVAQSIAGGVASFLEEIAPYQASAYGQQAVSFVVPEGSEKHLPDVDPSQLIRFARSSRSPAGLLDFARTATSAIRRLKPDIVHLHSSFAGAVIRAAFAASGAAPRIIYCPHGWAFSIDTSQAKKQVYAALERSLASRTDLILVNSQSEYDLAMRFGLPPAKTRVVKNGIAWAPLRERTGSTGPIRLAFIGRHDRQKGLDILLETIRRFGLADLQFEIVGDGVLQRGRSQSEPAPPNVRFHGWLSRRETLELLHTVDAVVMPSRWDAAPIVAIEAMRAGVPVIASNRGALPEMIQHGVGGYIFDMDDPDSLGRVLEAVTRKELERLGATARGRWERHYVSERMNELTCQAYRDVVAASNSSRVEDDAQIEAASPCGHVRAAG